MLTNQLYTRYWRKNNHNSVRFCDAVAMKLVPFLQYITVQHSLTYPLKPGAPTSNCLSRAKLFTNRHLLQIMASFHATFIHFTTFSLLKPTKLSLKDTRTLLYCLCYPFGICYFWFTELITFSLISDYAKCYYFFVAIILPFMYLLTNVIPSSLKYYFI